MNEQLVNDAVGILVFLPAIGVWIIAMLDVLTRRDIGARRRIVTAVAIGLVFPLTLLYLLGRPPSSVRRGPETAGDPRTPLLRRLEAGPAGDDLGADEGFGEWIALSMEGQAPPTR